MVLKKQQNQHITGLYMLRPFGAWATQKRSRACALCAFLFRHILRLLDLLRKSLSAAAKRHIQPERYVPVF
jgi:hypothetical protein